MELGTPHCPAALSVLKFLRSNPDNFELVEPKDDIHSMFDTKPTFELIVTDLRKAQNIKIIDNGTTMKDSFLEGTPELVLDCIHAVENKIFSTSRSRHYAAFDIPASQAGLLKCQPKIPPPTVLTECEARPYGTFCY